MIKKILIIFTILLFLSVTSMYGGSKKKEEKEPSPEREKPSEVQTFPEAPPTPPPLYTPETVEEKEEQKRPSQGTIRGKVVDESNNPVEGVEVLCMDEQDEIAAKATTDRDGRYVFKDLEKGEYTVKVDYSGLGGPLEIKFEEERRTPPIPTGLVVWEIRKEFPTESFIKAAWNKIPEARFFKCELYSGEEAEPITVYPDMMQNFCEFGGLKQATQYRVRVYSKNQYGYSASYAMGEIKTINKPPPSPFGLGVTYAKNHRVDLIWSAVRVEDLKGFILQVKKATGPYLFYSRGRLVEDKSEAFVIEPEETGRVTFSIDDRRDDSSFLLENVDPYSFRVFSIDNHGALSSPSAALENVALEDTVPPSAPYNITYQIRDQNRIEISWESKDSDIEKYRLYYGAEPQRWDGVRYTKNKSYELVLQRSRLEQGKLYVAVKAIDRAGNESGYRPVKRSVQVEPSQQEVQDITLSEANIYRSIYPVVKRPAEVEKKKPEEEKPTAEKKPARPTRYSYLFLAQKGFVVEKGETATLTGRITVPENTIIKVAPGGKLILKSAEISPRKGIWGGIRFINESGAEITNSVIKQAAIGIAVMNNPGYIECDNLEVTGCEEYGIYVKNSKLEFSQLNIHNNILGMAVENSDVRIANSSFKQNQKGLLAKNYSLEVNKSYFEKNEMYGLRLYGGGTIKGCTFNNNMVGLVMEEGKGRATVKNSSIENNRMDGMVVSGQSPEVEYSSISNNGRHGIYAKNNANPIIVSCDIMNNQQYAVVGGGRIKDCHIAYNNGSVYIDDTTERGLPDNVFTSSSSGFIKQILDVDYIKNLVYESALR